MNSKEVLNNGDFISIKKALIFAGIWPYQSKIYKMCVRIFFIIAIFSMIIPQQIRSVAEIQKDSFDITIIYENCVGFMYLKGCFIKYLAYIIYENKLKTIYEEITADYQEIKEERELRYLLKNAGIGRKLAHLYMAYGYIGCIVFVSINIVIPVALNRFFPTNESRPIALCYYAEYFVDQQKYFSLLYMHTLICVYCTVFIWTAVDTSYVSSVLHTVGLVKIIQYRIKIVGEKFLADLKNNSDLNEIELQKYIIDSIKLHNKSIQFANILNETYDKCYFYTFTMFVCGFGILTVDLVHSLDNIPNLIRISTVFFGVFTHLFYLTWSCQSLIDANEQLRKDIYFSGWYNLPRRAKFLLYFMMQRCNKPCKMTAGPLLELNMQHSGMIIKAGMSYTTVALSFA